jgi:ribosomal protein L40E
MPIRLQCSCGKQLSVRDEFAGKAVKCPACSKAIRVPASGGGTKAAAPQGAKPQAAKPRAAAARPAAPRPASPAASSDSLDDLFAEEGFDRQIAAVCPACKAEMAAGAVLCTKCGYNKETGSNLEGHKVAGVDIDMGTLALMKAEKDMVRDVALQEKMHKGAGMPPWMLALILFIVGSAVVIAVLAVNASRRTEQLQFKPLQMFCNLGGSAFAMVAIGCVLTLIARAFKVSRNEGLLSLTILYVPVFVIRHFRDNWRPAVTAIICGGCAGGFFAMASRM